MPIPKSEMKCCRYGIPLFVRSEHHPKWLVMQHCAACEKTQRRFVRAERRNWKRQHDSLRAGRTSRKRINQLDDVVWFR